MIKVFKQTTEKYFDEIEMIKVEKRLRESFDFKNVNEAYDFIADEKKKYPYHEFKEFNWDEYEINGYNENGNHEEILYTIDIM